MAALAASTPEAATVVPGAVVPGAVVPGAVVAGAAVVVLPLLLDEQPAAANAPIASTAIIAFIRVMHPPLEDPGRSILRVQPTVYVHQPKFVYNLKELAADSVACHDSDPASAPTYGA